MRHALIGLLMFCAACASQPAGGQVSTPDPVWSLPVTLAQTQQTDAPALLVNNGEQIAAWIGVDERGVHQDARRFSASGLTATITLPLPPTHPYGQQLFPGDGGNIHLLWLDAGANDQTNLFAALLAPDLTVERGPISVSEGLALRFSAVPDDSGGLWTAWSGGILSELALYVRRIDSEGRPLLDSTRFADAADNPALVRTAGGEVWLFWVSNGQLMRRRLDPQSEAAQALTSAVSLAPGDRLIDTRAALDSTSAYFFWNITRVSGVGETWLTAGPLNASSWRPPQRLRISLDQTQQAASGFAPGSIPVASIGGDVALRWAEPLQGQYSTLAVAVESDDGLGIVVLRGGEVVGYTTAAPGVRLIGAPALAVDGAGNLDLAWSAPSTSAADLQWITTGK